MPPSLMVAVYHADSGADCGTRCTERTAHASARGAFRWALSSCESSPAARPARPVEYDGHGHAHPQLTHAYPWPLLSREGYPLAVQRATLERGIRLSADAEQACGEAGE